MLGLHGYRDFSLAAENRGSSPVATHGLLTVMASLAWSTGSRAHQRQQLQHVDSIVVAPRF